MIWLRGSGDRRRWQKWKRISITPQENVAAGDTGAAMHVDSLDAAQDMSDPMELGDEDPAFRTVEASIGVARALSSVPARDQEVVRLRFGHGLTQAEIGKAAPNEPDA